MPLHKVANTLFYSKGDIMIRLCNSETVNGCRLSQIENKVETERIC